MISYIKLLSDNEVWKYKKEHVKTVTNTDTFNKTYLLENSQKGSIINFTHLQGKEIGVIFGRLDLNLCILLDFQGEIVFAAGTHVAL